MEMIGVLTHMHIISQLGDFEGKMLRTGQLRAAPLSALCCWFSQRWLLLTYRSKGYAKEVVLNLPNDSTQQCLMLWWPSTIKLFSLLLHNCNVGTVMNSTVNIWYTGFWYANPVKGLLTPNGLWPIVWEPLLWWTALWLSLFYRWGNKSPMSSSCREEHESRTHDIRVQAPWRDTKTLDLGCDRQYCQLDSI